MREIKEEDKEDDYSDSNISSDDKGDAEHDNPGDDAVELMEIAKRNLLKLSAMLSLDDVTECRNDCSELSSAELDLVILGIIHSSLNCNETSISGRVEKTCQSTRMYLFYHRKRICKKTFLFLHCLQSYRFRSLVEHYRKSGLTLQTHGNSNRLPSSATSTETVEQVVKFIKNTAEE